MEYKMFIDGQWVDSESGETMDVINPANQEIVARVPLGGRQMWKKLLMRLEGLSSQESGPAKERVKESAF